jgi:hypothetical protein
MKIMITTDVGVFWTIVGLLIYAFVIWWLGFSTGKRSVDR